MSDLLGKDEALFFRDQLREARSKALQDAEGFETIVFVLERLGCFLTGEQGNLGKFSKHIVALASQSPLFYAVPDACRDLHIPFPQLYELVREARNSAMHGGAAARYATAHAVELALVLEDALMNGYDKISDFMVRNVVSAEMWQPLSFIRQRMLESSFSCLPVRIREGPSPGWYLVSDTAIARYLRLRANGTPLKQALVQPLSDAIRGDEGLKLMPAARRHASESVAKALASWDGQPILVMSGKGEDLVGILTPYDLL